MPLPMRCSKLIAFSFLSSISLTLCAVSFAGSSATFPTFDVSFGYGVFNLQVNVTQPVQVFEFDYGSADYQLSTWGPINQSNATLSVTDLHNGLYHYTITPKNAAQPFQPANGMISIVQIPLLINNIPTKNMAWNNYYGLFQHIKINGNTVNYAHACQNNACDNPMPNKMLGGYYADWSAYPGSGGFRPTNIDLNTINKLFYAFGAANPQTGDAEMFDPYADAAMSGVNAVPYFSLQALAYPYLNVAYSFGGWGASDLGNYQSGDLSLLFTYHPENIQHFADTLVGLINRAGFNGVDIDYEWNAPQVPNPPNGEKPLGTALTQATADGFVTLLYDIRHESHLPPNFKLTVPLMAGKDRIDELASFKYQGPIANLKGQSDFSILAQEVDTIDLMTYDYHGAFDVGNQSPHNITDFLAPLSIPSSDPNNSDPILKAYNIEGSVAAIKAADPAIKNSQLSIGIPAYGRLEQVASTEPVNANNRGLFLPLATNQGSAAGELGNSTVNYRCLSHPQTDCLNNYQLPADMINILGPFNSSDPIGNVAQTAWAYSIAKNQFISFDSAATAFGKGQWIKQQGFAGAMIWELDGDLNKAVDADYQTNSIVMNVYRGMK